MTALAIAAGVVLFLVVFQFVYAASVFVVALLLFGADWAYRMFEGRA